MPAWDRRGLAQRFSAKRKRRWPSPFAICSVPCKPPFGTSRDHIVAPPRWCGCPAIPCCNMSNPWSNRKEMVGHKQQLTLTVIRPADGIRWHRAGSRAYWRCKSRPRGSPQSSASMSGKAQPPNTWQSVSGSQGWRAFLRNYADGVASMDLTVGARCPVVSFWMSNSTDVRTDFDIL